MPTDKPSIKPTACQWTRALLRDYGILALLLGFAFSYWQSCDQLKNQYVGFLESTHVELVNNKLDLQRVSDDISRRKQGSFYNIRTTAAENLLQHPLVPRQIRIDLGVYLSAMQSRSRALDAILGSHLDSPSRSDESRQAMARMIEGGYPAIDRFLSSINSEFQRLGRDAPIDAAGIRGEDRVIVPNAE